MASKMLSIRISEEMLNDLKEVCGELNINVTDVVKSLISKLIEERKIDNKIEFQNEDIEDFLVDYLVETQAKPMKKYLLS